MKVLYQESIGVTDWADSADHPLVRMALQTLHERIKQRLPLPANTYLSLRFEVLQKERADAVVDKPRIRWLPHLRKWACFATRDPLSGIGLGRTPLDAYAQWRLDQHFHRGIYKR